MKAILIIFFCSVYFSSSAQLSILFVDDSNDNFDNSVVFRNAVTASGFESILYNVPDSSSGPSVQYMFNFDLVIWHTSSIGNGLELWDGTGQDNENIKGYLDGGGMLWLVGLDFLFDRYGVAPATFQEGDFVNDYLGVSSYDVQSNGDDGGLGVPLVYPDENTSISGLNTLTWTFETSWWVDGVTQNENAEVVYRMGDESYIFAEQPCGIYYEAEDFKTLTYFFDLAQVANEDMLGETVLAVLNHFNELVLDVTAPETYLKELSVYPNPARSGVTLTFTLNESLEVTVEMVDIQGKPIASLMERASLPPGINKIQLSLPEYLPPGMYVLKVNAGNKMVYQKLVIGNS